MAGYVERGSVPGVVALVSRGDEVHVGRDAIFRISSMTKPVTAVAAMMLLEECKLRLDEPVDRLLPELADRRVMKRESGRSPDDPGGLVLPGGAEYLSPFLDHRLPGDR